MAVGASYPGVRRRQRVRRPHRPRLRPPPRRQDRGRRRGAPGGRQVRRLVQSHRPIAIGSACHHGGPRELEAVDDRTELDEASRGCPGSAGAACLLWGGVAQAATSTFRFTGPSRTSRCRRGSPACASWRSSSGAATAPPESRGLVAQAASAPSRPRSLAVTPGQLFLVEVGGVNGAGPRRPALTPVVGRGAGTVTAHLDKEQLAGDRQVRGRDGAESRPRHRDRDSAAPWPPLHRPPRSAAGDPLRHREGLAVIGKVEVAACATPPPQAAPVRPRQARGSPGQVPTGHHSLQFSSAPL